MTIWVDAWQMQCCGELFSVGSRVAWTLAKADPDRLTPLLGASVTIDAAEEHHGGVPDATPRTKATVTAISAVHCQHAPAPGGDQRMLYPSPPPQCSPRSHLRTVRHGTKTTCTSSDTSSTSPDEPHPAAHGIWRSGP